MSGAESTANRANEANRLCYLKLCEEEGSGRLVRSRGVGRKPIPGNEEPRKTRKARKGGDWGRGRLAGVRVREGNIGNLVRGDGCCFLAPQVSFRGFGVLRV